MKPSRWLALACGAVLTIAGLRWAAQMESSGAVVHAPTASSLQAHPSGARPSQALALPAPIDARRAAPSGPPPEPAAAAAGLTAEEWIALRQELASHPDGEAEFQRVAGFLSFRRQWEAFEALKSKGSDQMALRTLARSLDNALPERWQHGELTGPQALQIKARLLEVLIPEPGSRQQALLQWHKQHQPAARAQPAESAFLAEQARLADAWQAQRPGQRRFEPLTAQLEALRMKSFAGPDPHNPVQGKQP